MRNLTRGLIAAFSLNLIIGYSFYRHSQQKLNERHAPAIASSSKNSLVIGSGGWADNETRDLQKRATNEPPVVTSSSKSGFISILPKKAPARQPAALQPKGELTISTLEDNEFLVPVRYQFPDASRQYYPPPLVKWSNNRFGYLFPSAKESAPEAVKTKFFTSSKSIYAVIVMEDIRDLFRIEPEETPLADASTNDLTSTLFDIPTLDELIESQSAELTDWETREILSPRILTHRPIGGWNSAKRATTQISR